MNKHKIIIQQVIEKLHKNVMPIILLFTPLLLTKKKNLNNIIFNNVVYAFFKLFNFISININLKGSKNILKTSLNKLY